MHQMTITAPNARRGSLPDSYLPVPVYQHEYFTIVDFTVTRKTRLTSFRSRLSFEGKKVIHSVSKRGKVSEVVVFSHRTIFLMALRKGLTRSFGRWAKFYHSSGWPLKHKKPVMDKARHCCAVMTWYDNCSHERNISIAMGADGIKTKTIFHCREIHSKFIMKVSQASECYERRKITSSCNYTKWPCL